MYCEGNSSCSRKSFPYEILEYETKDCESLMQIGVHALSVGPKKFCVPKKFKEEADKLYNFELRDDDIWLLGITRSGTTVAQELIWLICNNLDFDKASKEQLVMRFPSLEHGMLFDISSLKNIKEGFKKSEHSNMLKNHQIDFFDEMKSPRCIKAHIPISLLSKDLLTSKCKKIYVARNPKDVIVSQWKVVNLYKEVNLESFWELFKKDLFFWTPYFEHIKEGWAIRHHKNVFFYFYEDYMKNKKLIIEKIAEFLEKPLSQDQIDKIEDYLGIEKFKKNSAVNKDYMKDVGLFRHNSDNSFIRDGKTEGWRQYFSEEIKMEVEKWIEDNLKSTDLRFPN